VFPAVAEHRHRTRVWRAASSSGGTSTVHGASSSSITTESRSPSPNHGADVERHLDQRARAATLEPAREPLGHARQYRARATLGR
jgi:hypothetical protein